MHVDVVLLDLVQPELNIEIVLRDGAGFGSHAENEPLSLVVALDAHVAARGFELVQVFLGVKMTMKIDVHGSYPRLIL